MLWITKISFIALSYAAVQSSGKNGEPTDIEAPTDFLADESSLVGSEAADEFSDLEVPYAIRTKRAAGKAVKILSLQLYDEKNLC